MKCHLTASVIAVALLVVGHDLSVAQDAGNTRHPAAGKSSPGRWHNATGWCDSTFWSDYSASHLRCAASRGSGHPGAAEAATEAGAAGGKA